MIFKNLYLLGIINQQPRNSLTSATLPTSQTNVNLFGNNQGKYFKQNEINENNNNETIKEQRHRWLKSISKSDSITQQNKNNHRYNIKLKSLYEL